MSVAKSGISWCDATWNPIRGCSPIGEGCRNCYAARMASRFPWGAGYAYGGTWTGVVHVLPETLDQPLHWRKPCVIFVNSMSDLFHPGVSDRDIGRIFAMMAEAHWHTYVVLTKRPERMLDWSRVVCHYPQGNRALRPAIGWPPNVWLGVSCWDQESLDAMVPILLETPAAHRVLSLEPLLGSVDLRFPHADEDGRCLVCGEEYEEDCRHECAPGFGQRLVDQVLVGGETGPGARPCRVEWVRSILRQCDVAGVPCHFKQPGRWVSGDHAGFLVDRWLIDGGGVWVPPIIGPYVDVRPDNAVAFGTTKWPDGWPEDLRAAHGPGSLAWGRR